MNNLPADLKSRIDRWDCLVEDHFPKDGDLVFTLIKGHLIIESLLSSVIKHRCIFEEHLSEARLTFKQKICVARSMVAVPTPEHLWATIEHVNKLRNHIAHNLESQNSETLYLKTSSIAEQLSKSPGALSAPDTKSRIDCLRYVLCFSIGQLMTVDALVGYAESKIYG